ncbi:MAG: DegT/DnrJ/EryC1/StrS family aminotransferase [Verrucomicrobia bacterium]|nr:DegT/DnrJ/EryC1/StrS family aminotransferase [Verrucomicrobiota bacterium]
MPVPLLDVNAQNHPLEAEFTAAFQRVFRSGIFIGGPEITALEDEIARLVGAKHAIGVSSGTDAILIALMALDIGPGDQVLCPAFTFFATAGCVSRLGATPVFVDVCPICFNIDLNDAAAKITSRTKAIIPVHLFGQSAEMDRVMQLASQHGLNVIEDAAQAIGATYRERACGTIGDFGTYSFFPSKNLGGLGDSGLVVTNNDTLAAKSRALRNHGMEPKYYHSTIGGNFRIDALQAALLRVKLPHYARYTAARRANADFYTRSLGALPGAVQANAKDCVCRGAAGGGAQSASLVLPVELPDNGHIWNQYTLRVIGEGRRDALRDHLTTRKIGCDIYYPLTLDRQKCFAYLPASSRSGCDIAHQLASEVLSIPIYAELSESQRDEVVAALADFLR